MSFIQITERQIEAMRKLLAVVVVKSNEMNINRLHAPSCLFCWVFCMLLCYGIATTVKSPTIQVVSKKIEMKRGEYGKIPFSLILTAIDYLHR